MLETAKKSQPSPSSASTHASMPVTVCVGFDDAHRAAVGSAFFHFFGKRAVVGPEGIEVDLSPYFMCGEVGKGGIELI